MVERAMADAGADFPEISRITVTRGPGSFTGIRIALAAARGLALATGAGITAVPTFEALRPDECPEGRLFAVLDTKRGSLYAADLSGAAEPFVTTAGSAGCRSAVLRRRRCSGGVGGAGAGRGPGARTGPSRRSAPSGQAIPSRSRLAALPHPAAHRAGQTMIAADLSHAEIIAALHRAAMPEDAWSADAWRSLLSAPGARARIGVGRDRARRLPASPPRRRRGGSGDDRNPPLCATARHCDRAARRRARPLSTA